MVSLFKAMASTVQLIRDTPRDDECGLLSPAIWHFSHLQPVEIQLKPRFFCPVPKSSLQTCRS